MLDEFPEAQGFADEPELLFDGVVGGDFGGGGVEPEEVPRVEAGEVLERAQEFVAADWRREVVSRGGVEGRDKLHTGCRDELEVVGYRRVVD